MVQREVDYEMAHVDTDKDGQITWKEYYDVMHAGEAADEPKKEPTKAELLALDDAKKLFAAADHNSDGSLTSAELRAFRYPTLNEETSKLLLARSLEHFDTDKSGAVDEAEYMAHLASQHDEASGEQADKEALEQERLKFHSHYDQNKDGVLTGDEILRWAGPVQIDQQAAAEVEHLFHSCDADKDGLLTPDEILTNHELWLSAEVTDFGKRVMDEL